jgi:hypothetical protein
LNTGTQKSINMFTKILQSLCIFYLLSTGLKNLLSIDLLIPVHGRHFYVINLTNECILSLCAGVEHGHSKFNKYVEKFWWNLHICSYLPLRLKSSEYISYTPLDVDVSSICILRCFLVRGWCMRKQPARAKFAKVDIAGVRASLLSRQAHQSVSSTQTERGVSNQTGGLGATLGLGWLVPTASAVKFLLG